MSFVELEGGLSAAAEVLRAYDRASGTWSLPKEGEFWEAVALAHRLGRTGRGRRIAVIDGAFDTQVPALAKQHVACRAPSSEPSDHGTAVALLVHEVAPEAELHLYSVSLGGAIDANLVEAALEEIALADFDVVNISFGQAHDWSEVGKAPERSPATEQTFYEHLASWCREAKGRIAVDAQPLFLCRLARRVAERGATVVAAIGNRFDKVYSPAIDDSVIACGFHTVGRRVNSGGEEVAWSVPRFDQSPMNADVLLIQPAGVLGSSFSAPLVAGFAALMTDRRELPAFCESARLAGLASAAEPTLGSRWNAQEHGAVDAIYRDALLAAPHRHLPESNAGPCPECALLARPAYVDWGLFKAKAGDLAGAEVVLRIARAFAPFDVHAAANLGVVLLELAKRGEAQDVGRVLSDAKDHLELAVSKRPEHQPYADRLREATALQSLHDARSRDGLRLEARTPTKG